MKKKNNYDIHEFLRVYLTENSILRAQNHYYDVLHTFFQQPFIIIMILQNLASSNQNIQLLNIASGQYILGQKTALIISAFVFLLATFIFLIIRFGKLRNFQEFQEFDSASTQVKIFLKQLLKFPCIILSLSLVPAYIILSEVKIKETQQISNISNYFILILIVTAMIFLATLLYFQRRFITYGSYLIPICLARSILALDVFRMIMVISSAYMLSKEARKPQKTFYLNYLVWNLLIFIYGCFNQTPKISNLFFTMAMIFAFSFFDDKHRNNMDNAEENAHLLEKIAELKLKPKLQLSENAKLLRIIQSFSQKCVQTKNILSKDEQNLIQAIKQSITLQTLIDFSILKAEVETRMQTASIQCEINLYFLKIQLQEPTMSLLLEVQKFFEKVKSSEHLTFQIEYKLQQLQKQIAQNITNKNKQIDCQNILLIEKCRERVSTLMASALNAIISFWQMLYKQNVQYFDAVSKVEAYMLVEKDLRSEILRLKKFRQPGIQLQIYNCMISMINFTCEDLEIDVDKQSQNCDENISSTNYILIENSKIISISKFLVNRLKLKYEDVIGEQFETIFPPEFRFFARAIIKNIIKLSQENVTLSLPFYSQSQQMITPFQVAFQIFHTQSAGIHYFLTFQSEENHTHSFPSFLYGERLDRIIKISDDFFTYFKIDKQDIDAQQIGESYFGFQLGSAFKKTHPPLRQLDCDFRLMNNDLAGFKKKMSIPVQIKLCQMFEPENGETDNTVFLFQIMRRTEATQIFFSEKTLCCWLEKEKSEQIQKRQIIIQQSFCKIPNPLEHYVFEKIRNVKNFYHFSYGKVGVLLIFSLSLMIVIILVLLNLSSSRKSQILQKNLIDDNMVSYDLVSHSYDLFIRFYQLYQMETYPNHIQNLHLKENVTSLKQNYSRSIAQQISYLIQQRLSHKILQQSVNFTISYPMYDEYRNSLSVDTVFFYEMIKETLNTHNYSVFVRNQNAIETVIDSYQIIDDEVLDEILNQQYKYISIFLVTIMLIAIAFQLLTIKLHFVVYSIINSYNFISREEMDMIQVALQNFKHKIENKLISNNEGSIYKQREADKAIGNEVQNENNHSIKCDSPLVKPPQLSRVVFKNFYLSIICVLQFISLFIYYRSALHYHQEEDELISYWRSLQQSINAINKEAYLFYGNGMNQVLIHSVKPTKNIWQNYSLTINFDDLLPEQFDDYKAYEASIVYSDICGNQYILSSIDYFHSISCDKILNGVLKKGVGQTFELYSSLIRKNELNSISSFGNAWRANSTYPIFVEICYLQSVFQVIFSDLIDKFIEKFCGNIEQWNVYFHRILNINWIFFIFNLFTVLILYFYIQRFCHLGIKCFKIIPRRIVLKLSTTKKMMNLGIFKEIQRLYF